MGYDYWDFIERYLPDYFSDDDVCLSNDIVKLLDEPGDASDECKRNVQQYVDDVSDCAALADLLIEVDTRLFKEALSNYLKNEKR